MFPNGNDRLKQWEEKHNKWPAVRERGVRRYVLREALRSCVELTIILILAQWIQNHFSKKPEVFLYFVVLPPIAFLIGAFTGWSNWQSSEREYQAEEERRQRLRERRTDGRKPVDPRMG